MARRKKVKELDAVCLDCGWAGDRDDLFLVHEDTPYPGYKRSYVKCPKCQGDKVRYAPWPKP